RPAICGLQALRIDVMNRDVRIGNRRLFQILIDAAAAAYESAFQLDRNARAASQFVGVMRVLIITGFRGWVVGHPFDAMIGDVLVSLLAGRYIFTASLAVDDLGQIPLGVDL